jgi:hypothetical protein
MINFKATFKLNKDKTGYKIYDDENIYEETVKADLNNFVDLLARGYKFQRAEPTTIEGCCYGCATMRSRCTNPQGENYGD